jgi:thioredoxin type arsenate reductase
MKSGEETIQPEVGGAFGELGPATVVRPGKRRIRRLKVLFLCTHNSARSQLAEAILRHFVHDRVEVQSAGMVATRVHPLAIEVAAEHGLDLSSHRSKAVDEVAGERFDLVITVCDDARESCPVLPGTPEQLHWSIPDPAAVEGNEEEKRNAFRRAYETLVERIRGLLELIDRRSG